MQIAELFRPQSGDTLQLSFGSTGKLYAQIRAGASFDVFFGADRATPQRVEQEGLTVNGSGFVYALGKLVLVERAALLRGWQGRGVAQGQLRQAGHLDPSDLQAVWLAHNRKWYRSIVAALVALPLVLRPTVLGFYVPVLMGLRGRDCN